jgi:hypothetical protein
MLSPGTKKRLSRIRRRALPAVREAFERGEISGKRADLLLCLPEGAQAAELDRILRAQEEQARRSTIAARVIKEYVEAGRHDLVMLQKDLRHALQVTLPEPRL